MPMTKMVEYEPPGALAVPVDTAGPRRRIYAYRLRDGRAPAVDGLEALDPQAQARYFARFREMGMNGQLRGKYYHPWKGKAKGMAAFKDNQSQTRIPSFPDGAGNLILTHVIEGKKEDKIPEADENEALRYRAEYLERKARMMPKAAAAGGGRGR